MRIRNRLEQFRDIAVTVGVFTKETSTSIHAATVKVVGFIKRHKKASIVVAVVLLIAGPLLTGAGGGAFVLNLVGLGIIALVVRRIVQAGNRKQAAQARQANCRCRCHGQQPRRQQTANQQP